MNCEKCGTNSCNLTLKEVQNFILNINELISKLSASRIDNYYYGYDCETETSSLHLYKFLLEKFVKDNLRGVECTCPEVIEKIITKLQKYIPKPKDIDVEIDRSKEEQWIKNNIFCTTKARWKKLAYKICHDIELDIRLVPEDIVCDLALEVKIGTLDCNIIEALSVSSINCQTGVKVDRTEQECKIDYKLLIENINDAPSFKTYMNAVRKNHMTFDQILDIYKSGAKIEQGKEGCILKTQLRTYPLSELTFKSYFESEKVNNGLIESKPSNIKKYQRDYKNSGC